MATPVFQAAGTVVEGAVAVTPPWPAHQANDIGLMFVDTKNQNIGTIPSGWAHVTNSPVGIGTAGDTTASMLTILWKRAESSAESDLSIGDSGGKQLAVILTFRGCIETGNPWDVTASGTETADTSVSIPGATTTVGECLIVAAVAAAIDLASTEQLSGWTNASLVSITERIDNFASGGPGGGLGIATGEKTAAGAYDATTATLATSAAKAMMSVALKPPAATGNSNFFPFF